MFNILQQTNNHSMIIEVVLFDTTTVKNLTVTGLGLKVFFGILLLIMETIGNYLLFCMVWYEKFGMDSKKRTVTNQLLSRMICALIFFNIFFMPLFYGSLFISYGKYFQGFYDWILILILQHLCLLCIVLKLRLSE